MPLIIIHAALKEGDGREELRVDAAGGTEVLYDRPAIEDFVSS